MRKRYLAALMALVILITAIPVGSGTFASEIENTPAPSVTLLGSPDATPEVTAASTAEATVQPTDAPAATTDDTAVTPAAKETAQPTDAPVVTTDDTAVTPAAKETALSTDAPAVTTDDTAVTPAAQETAQPTNASAATTDDTAITPAAKETAQPTNAPAATTDDTAVTPAAQETAQPTDAPAATTDDTAVTPAAQETAWVVNTSIVEPTVTPAPAPLEAPVFEIHRDVLVRYHGEDRKVVIPAGVREIGKDAFRDNEHLEKVVLGEDVEVIGERAFAGCVELETVVINDKLEEIKSKAFEDCRKLSPAFADDVEKVAGNAFKGCLKPTEVPTEEPTEEPTAVPSVEPTADPTEEPTAEPTSEPSVEPTADPTEEPTAEPTAVPSVEPTADPTEEPTVEPTAVPSVEPTADPTEEPTVEPTAEPSEALTAEPEPATPSDLTGSLPTLEPESVLPTEEPFDDTLATDTDLPEGANLATDTDLPEDANLNTDTDLPEDANLATDTDLPADHYLCGIAEHIHDASCFGENGTLVCGLEEHCHTADCLVYPLTLALSGDALFVYANEEPAVYRASIAGGRAPYTLQVRGEILPLTDGGNASTVACAPTSVDEEGPASFLYAPMSGGMHCLTVTVTDAEGRTAAADTLLPVSVRTSETEADWRATFAQAQLTGDPRTDVIAIARTQLGYTASRTDFTVQPGGDWMHYSRYGAWYGSPYINWCAAFAGFCLHYAGVTDVPFHSNCGEWLSLLQAQGLYRPADAYFPMPGDVVFIDHDGNGTADHAGLAEALTVTRTGDEIGFRFTLSTIEGNREGQVGSFSYDASDATILGYGQIAGSVGDGFAAVIDALINYDAEQAFTGSEEAAAGLVFQRLQAALDAGLLSEEDYTALWTRLGMMLYGSVAERAEGTNWMRLRDSGWINAYSAYANVTEETQTADAPRAASYALRAAPVPLADPTATPPSDQQVVDRGGSNSTTDGVSVSKTIAGTDLENVFDITLQVQTSMNMTEIITEPDMAVVIVMDISNTMNDNFGGVTRYAAAMTAAESFLDQFAASNSLGISKVGYVAFNTNAHEIFGLSSCTSQSQANGLKNTMRQKTGNIINYYHKDEKGNVDDPARFTNIEAGLNMANNLLNGASNKNKYIIFLSDGFPTTYISSGNSGYDPYTPGATSSQVGQFYDDVFHMPCKYGTSYSDRAAIRASQKATALKNAGVTIFSIGVDVGGQTIQAYVDSSEKHLNESDKFSIVDRTSKTYEIGDATNKDSYKNWLRDKIGSGYYYDSTDSAGLTAAFEKIFAEIKTKNEAGAVADWVASDPLPKVEGIPEYVEFISFYNKAAELADNPLSGSHTAGGENTATFDTEQNAISWDLKNSGYTMATSGSTTTYTYQLVYRVRLKNENSSFTEGTIYPTNGTTTLRYRTVETVNGNQTVSAPNTVDFPIPSVKGYLSELSFTKVDQLGRTLAGAVFTLAHDTVNCSICRGDGKSSVDVPVKNATSDANGRVSFTNIPSGHSYTLTETQVPVGAIADSTVYKVTVAYNEITITDENGQTVLDTVANPLTTLTISKEVIGSAEQQDDPFTFTLTLTPPNGETLRSAYDAQNFVWSAESDGWIKSGGIVSIPVANGTATFTLTHNQQLTIYGLPVGTVWVIAEDAPGYKVTVNSKAGSTATGTLQDSTDVAYTNQSMTRLPETGGPGTHPYTWAGIMLCMLSVLLYKLLKRRRGDEHLT